jgi:uncharacterized membrane protein
MKHSLSHYWVLGAIVAIATILRFWNLDFKPLWLDEVITAIFTLGRTYNDIPVGKILPLDWINTFFTWQPSSTCTSVAEAIRTQSTHPPVFFCLLHQWLALSQGNLHSLAWNLRSLSALAGVANVVAVYALGRLAVSPAAGLMAASLMAVSPFAVYLSQEARHYTVPMLVVSLALVGCVQIQQDLHQNQSIRPWVWGGWIAINSLGFYLHYFFLLVFVAQAVTLVALAIWKRASIQQTHWLCLGGAIAAILLTYLPWMSQLWEHIHQPATEWANVQEADWTTALAVFLRTITGWIVMLIILPMENQPLMLRRVLGLLTAAIAIWCFRQVARGITVLWQKSETRLMLLTLGGVILCVVAEYFVGIYGFGKDISRAFRYNFTFYPAAVVLIGASFAALPLDRSKPPRFPATPTLRRFGGFISGHRILHHPLLIQGIVVSLGFLSSLFVVSGFAFYKPYYPDLVTQRVQFNADTPLLVMQEYDRPQDLAFGLSLALALQQHTQPSVQSHKIYWSFIPTGTIQTSPLWQSSQGQQLFKQSFDLWKISDRQPVKWNLWNFIPMSTLLPVRGESIQQFLIPIDEKQGQHQILCRLFGNPFEHLGTQYHQYQCIPSGNNIKKS